MLDANLMTQVIRQWVVGLWMLTLLCTSLNTDVMTTLLTALSQQVLIRSAIGTPPPARPGWEQHPDALEETCQLLDLLWSIGETSAEAVQRFNAAGMPLVAPLVHFAATGGGEAVAAAAGTKANRIVAGEGGSSAQAAAVAAAAQVALAGAWRGREIWFGCISLSLDKQGAG